MDYYLEQLEKAYRLAAQAREAAGRLFVKAEKTKREAFAEAFEPSLELQKLMMERDRLIAQAASAAARAHDAFLTLWRIVPEEVRWAFYAQLHGLEMEGDKLVAFIRLRKGWPQKGFLDADEFPAWEREGERYYLVGSRELWERRPLYLKNDSPLAKVRVVKGELPNEPEGYIKCWKVEIIEVL